MYDDCQGSSGPWQGCKATQLVVQAAGRGLLERTGPAVAGASCRIMKGLLAVARDHVHRADRHH